MKKEYATLSFSLLEAKEQTFDKSNIGVFSGHLAAFVKDRINDVFMPGAFNESIERHKKSNRPIRMLFQHDSEFLIGGFPIEFVKEDEKGLFVVGNINLDVQKGREAFSLMRQGILTDMSIGFSIRDINDVKFENDIRFIRKAEIWEGSLVTEPMNERANVLEVKTVVPFQDLPLADRDREWDSDQAIARVREFTDSEDSPSSSYRLAFVWYDQEDAENFGAYKLPIADVVGGRMVAVPRGIFAAAGALQGARGGVDIPEADRPRVIAHIERYYRKMDLESPFSEEDKGGDAGKKYLADEVAGWGVKDIETALRKSGLFSRKAAKILASRVKDAKPDAPDYTKEDLEEINVKLSEIKDLFSGQV